MEEKKFDPSKLADFLLQAGAAIKQLQGKIFLLRFNFFYRRVAIAPGSCVAISPWFYNHTMTYFFIQNLQINLASVLSLRLIRSSALRPAHVLLV